MSNFNCQNYVGRVDVRDYQNGKPYSMTQDLGVNSKRGYENTLEHYQEETVVSKYFFSRKNIDILHKAISGTVNYHLNKDNINYKVGKQNEDHLLVVMRAKYLQEACHYQCSFIEQIKKLNGKVLDFIVPNVISNVKQYVGYIKDISSPIPTMDRPIDVNSRGNNTELQPDVGFVCFAKK